MGRCENRGKPCKHGILSYFVPLARRITRPDFFTTLRRIFTAAVFVKRAAPTEEEFLTMQTTKRITAVFLAFILTVGLFAAAPLVAYAATVDVDLSMATGSIVIQQANSDWVISGGITMTVPETDTLRITGTLSNDQIQFYGSLSGDIIFDGVTITASAGMTGVHVGYGSTLTVTLLGVNELIGDFSSPGLYIYGDSSVTISGSGSLECVGGSNNGNGISVSNNSMLSIIGGASVTATGNGTGWDIGAGNGSNTLKVDGGATLLSLAIRELILDRAI